MICKMFRLLKDIVLIERKLNMSKTKVVGVAILVTALSKIIVDAFDGNGFAIMQHVDGLIYALNGLGFYFLRDAVQKIKEVSK